MPVTFTSPQGAAFSSLASWTMLLLALLASSVVSAMEAEALQYPVWKERDGVRQGLAPGDAIAPGDTVLTGQGGKVWLRMEDGALVKLGEQANLSVAAVQVNSRPATVSASAASTQAQAESGDFLEATLDVLEGAFRYTTDKIRGAGWRRDVQLGLGSTATIGIRGTDLWGQVGPESQFVVLLEGVIELKAREGGKTVQLDTPLQIYQAAEASVGTVEMAQVQALAPETELDFGNGVQSQNGAFKLNVASFSSQADASAAQQRASRMGLSAQVEQVSVQGRDWYRLVLDNVASLADGEALQRRIQADLGYGDSWLGNS